MLECVERSVGEVVPHVRTLHANVVCHHIPVDAGDVHALLKGVMIYGKACNFLHDFSPLSKRIPNIIAYPGFFANFRDFS